MRLTKMIKTGIKTFLQSERGFSLAEVATVLVLAGVVMTPAIALYKQYQVQEDVEKTEENLNNILSVIGDYRAFYGRYPCPASETAVPGDNEYGHEVDDCMGNAPASGTCADGICAADSNIAGKVVLIGSIPFKTLNLQEPESYDEYLGRYTYAVTNELTDSATFDMQGGGISIEDRNGDSLVTLDDTAHYIVISHGSNKAGAITKHAQVSVNCNVGSALEQENCDDDETFISDERSNDFDDKLGIFSGVQMSEWQTSATDDSVIHLKNTDSIVVGAPSTANLSTSENVTAKSFAPGTGGIVVTEKTFTETLCDYDAATPLDCFEPSLIAGSLNFDGTRLEAETNGEAISCYKPGEGIDGYLIGIKNGQPICSEELFVSCPNGSYVRAINNDGSLVCNAPEIRCESETVSPERCGESFTLPQTNNNGVRKVYSGFCRMAPNQSEAFWEAFIDNNNLATVQADLVSLNSSVTRTEQNCRNWVSPFYTEDKYWSTVRHSYRCVSGNWEHLSSHERFRRLQSYSNNLVDGANIWAHAEESDCTCTEHYEAVEASCDGENAIGNKIQIWKSRCPRTNGMWDSNYNRQLVYTDTSGCGCTPGTTNETQSCASYYNDVTAGPNYPSASLNGNVTRVYQVNCVNGEPVRDPNPINEYHNCTCPNNADDITPINCSPAWTTNDWDWPLGTPRDGKAKLKVQSWICPATTHGPLAVPHPGYWDSVNTINGPACVCDETLTRPVHETCLEAGYPDHDGAGVNYTQPWNCLTQEWETDKDLWDEVSRDCNQCKWQQPAGAGTESNHPVDDDDGETYYVGGDCDTCGETRLCNKIPGTTSDYEYWSACQCVAQN